MKREERIKSYRATIESNENDCKLRFRDAEGRLAEAAHRLAELQNYRSEYERGLGNRVAGGMTGPALLDYHAFIARLGEAIRQQQEIVTRCELEREQQRSRLRDAAVQVRTVAAVVERWRTEDRGSESRREQREIDERAQISFQRVGARA